MEKDDKFGTGITIHRMNKEKFQHKRLEMRVGIGYRERDLAGFRVRISDGSLSNRVGSNIGIQLDPHRSLHLK